MNKELLFKTFRNTLGAAVYMFLVSQIMQNGSTFFGPKDTFLTPFVVLLLFSLSAAVVGGLVAGLSVMLFLDNKKKESIQALFYSIGWLALYTVIGMLLMLVVK